MFALNCLKRSPICTDDCRSDRGWRWLSESPFVVLSDCKELAHYHLLLHLRQTWQSFVFLNCKRSVPHCQMFWKRIKKLLRIFNINMINILFTTIMTKQCQHIFSMMLSSLPNYHEYEDCFGSHDCTWVHPNCWVPPFQLDSTRVDSTRSNSISRVRWPRSRSVSVRWDSIKLCLG